MEAKNVSEGDGVWEKDIVVLYPIVNKLLENLKAYDQYTYEHSKRVASYAIEFGELIGLSDYEQMELYVGALLHDIGKCSISTTLLNKKGKLSEIEYRLIKKHAEKGYENLVNGEKFREHTNILDIVLSHHERLNGSGYPYQKKEEELSLYVRMMGIVDSFDAMVTNRSYRKGMDIKKVLEELKNCSGTLYDSDLVQQFIDLITLNKIKVRLA